MLIRRCALCGREIQVSLPYSPTYVFYAPKRKWYHSDCFTAITTPRILKNDWFNKTKAYVIQEVSKDNIDKLFKNHYNLSLVPQYIYIELDSIYKGTLKGIAQPIPPHELLDILERKQSYIDKCLLKKNISGVQAVNYALAVAVGSYKSYKEWMAQCAAEREQTKKIAQEHKGKDISLKGYVPPDDPEPENSFVDFDEDEY